MCVCVCECVCLCVLVCVCLCVVNLGFQPSAVPQAGGQSLGADPLTLWLSEVLVQPVGPLTHGADVQPHSICRSKVTAVRVLPQWSGLKLGQTDTSAILNTSDFSISQMVKFGAVSLCCFYMSTVFGLFM